MKSRFLFQLSLCLFVCSLGSSSLGMPRKPPGVTAPVTSEDWRPIDPTHLALKTSTVEKDADAEAIFWEVKVDDGDAGELVFTNYVRVKIFTDRGKESQSKIDLPYLSRYKIKDVSARTIKSDGSIVELKPSDVYDRTIVKANGLKVKAKSFAMPAVEPGAIIEYRWREVRSNGSANYLDLQFQREIPVQSITYLVRPYSGPYANNMAYRQFQMPGQIKFEKAKDGFFRISMSNVAAFREEPRMPPEDSVRSWILLYYTENTGKTSPDKFWTDLGKRVYEVVKDDMKVNDEVRQAAAQAVGNATTPEEKLQRIYEFCQTKIKNVSYASSGLTAEERERFKSNKSPAETLKKGIGSGGNIDALFAAMATAQGFEAHMALSGNREHVFLDRDFTDPYFLLRRGSSFIAVRLGETWRFFSPSEGYTPYGMLGWREEGQPALVIDKEPAWVDTPISPPASSVQKRTGTFQLQEDGTLEGDVRIEYSGKLAIDRRYENDEDSQSEREKSLVDAVTSRISTAELSDIKIENVLDPLKPFVYSYHVRVPGYAQRTGKRIFLQPGFFTHGNGALFTSNDRHHSVYFRYPWSEEDHLTIELPAGYALDNADAPAGISPEQTQQISAYKISMRLIDRKTISYDRKFFFGGQNSIIFPVANYPALKELFDIVHRGDDHTITLKQGVATSSNQD
jgi:hypothetical protein